MKEVLYRRKTIELGICGVRILFRSEVPLAIPAELRPFLAEGEPDLTVPVRVGRMPEGRARLGQDLYQDHGTSDGRFWLAARMDGKETGIGTLWRPDFSEVTVLLNTQDYGKSICSLDKVLQYFPMPAYLLRHDVLLLHSSRIALDGRAIAFSAPSGTGKTTQARLWEQHAGARNVSNDRSLLRKTPDGVLSSGYPADGGEPVRDPTGIPLAALVLLEQGEENRAERLPVSKAFGALMNQTVLYPWDPEFMTNIQLLWAEILADLPVFRLVCTPDDRAVSCLQRELMRDGGIKFGRNSQPFGEEGRIRADPADGRV